MGAAYQQKKRHWLSQNERLVITSKPQPHLQKFFSLSLLEHEKLHSLRVIGRARGVMVIIVGNGHGITSSNPRRD